MPRDRPMGAPKVKVYGLQLTRKTYVIIQLVGFLWLLVLYVWWRWAELERHPLLLVRWLDAVLLLIYLYGVVETVLVLRKFKGAIKESKSGD